MELLVGHDTRVPQSTLEAREVVAENLLALRTTGDDTIISRQSFIDVSILGESPDQSTLALDITMDFPEESGIKCGSSPVLRGFGHFAWNQSSGVGLKQARFPVQTNVSAIIRKFQFAIGFPCQAFEI